MHSHRHCHTATLTSSAAQNLYPLPPVKCCNLMVPLLPVVVEEENGNQDQLFKAKHTKNERPPDNVKMKGIMVNGGVTSHIMNNIGKFKSFDDTFQPETHSVELADGTKCRNSRAKGNGDDRSTRQCWTTAQSTATGCTLHSFIPTWHIFSGKSNKRWSDNHLQERRQTHGYQGW